MSSKNYSRMISGQLYFPDDLELNPIRTRVQDLCWEFNSIRPSDGTAKEALQQQMFGSLGAGSTVMAPIQLDYGINTTIGEGCYLNFGTVILDCAKVTLGDRVLLGPGCSLITVGHPLERVLRAEGWEIAHPIVLEDDVWLGAGVLVMPGVTIGAGSVVGGGAVVTKDIPPRSLAVGAPAKVIRQLEEGEVPNLPHLLPDSAAKNRC